MTYQLPEPAGFSAGAHNGALFATNLSTGKNFAIGAQLPLCEWYSAEQMQAAYAAGREAMRAECVKFCAENQVTRSPRGGRTFMPFDASCQGIHEGMDFAEAIKELP